MILFILSEIMFFFSIFCFFFNFKINPSLYIECIFPPIGINIIKMNCFPLLNTVFLLICCYRLYLTYKFNFYKINKDLYLKKLYRVFFFEDFLEDLIKQDFTDIMYMILFLGIQDSIYHN